MLVLSRRVRQKIVITVPPSSAPRTIEVQCVEIKTCNSVRIGIEAPLDVKIHREEVQQEIDVGVCRG